MNIDHLFHKKHNKENYNCAHFLCEAWLYITGENINEKLKCFLLPSDLRFANIDLKNNFKRLIKPVSPCIVILSRPFKQSHVGMFYNNRLLHLTDVGTKFEPLEIAKIPFKTVRFYK